MYVKRKTARGKQINTRSSRVVRILHGIGQVVLLSEVKSKVFSYLKSSYKLGFAILNKTRFVKNCFHLVNAVGVFYALESSLLTD